MPCALWCTSALPVTMCTVGVFFMFFVLPFQYLRVGDDSMLCIKFTGVSGTKL